MLWVPSALLPTWAWTTQQGMLPSLTAYSGAWPVFCGLEDFPGADGLDRVGPFWSYPLKVRGQPLAFFTLGEQLTPEVQMITLI